MDNIIVILIVIIAIISCICIMCGIQNKKENFNNIRHGGYFIRGQKERGDNTIEQIPNRGGMSMEEKMELKKIVNMVLRKLNYDLKLNFHIVEFDHIVNKAYDYGVKRHIIDVFVHEVHNFYNRRLIIDLFIDSNKRIFNVNSITVGNAREDNTKDKIPNKKLFDNKIISGNNLKKPNLVLGRNNTSLEFNLLDYKPNHISNKNFTKWILPQEYINHLNNTSKNVWPCRNEEHNWDEDGVSITENIDITKDCYGNNSSYTKNRIVPKFLPNIKNNNSKSDYNWLFGSFKTDGRNAFMGGRGHGIKP